VQTELIIKGYEDVAETPPRVRPPSPRRHSELSNEIQEDEVNKRIVVLGVSAAMALGAGAAVAADQDLSTNQGNVAYQDNYQRSDPWQKTWQDSPEANSGADASANVAISAGGDSKSSLASGNGKVWAKTYGGSADSTAKNTNDGSQDVSQSSSQNLDQSNKSNGNTTVAIDDSLIKIVLGKRYRPSL
jgi:hypothetical protein